MLKVYGCGEINKKVAICVIVLDKSISSMNSLLLELRFLFRPWLLCVLLTLPFLLFWHSPEGRSCALNAFFLGCMIMVAHSFYRDIRRPGNFAADTNLKSEKVRWSDRIIPLSIALFSAFVVFSGTCLLFSNPHSFESPLEKEDQGIWLRFLIFKTPHDFVAPMLALMTLIPSLGLVPYFVLATRNRFIAIVFSAFIEGCMKFLGAIILVSIYGWNADEQGRTHMPWNHPDLLVWLFWGFSLLFSVGFYFLGMKKFDRLSKTASYA